MNPTAPLEEKIRPFLVPIILGIVTLGVLLIVVFPQFNRLKINNQVLSDRQKAARILDTKLSSLEALDETSQVNTLETALLALPLEEPFRQSLLNLDGLLIRHQIAASQIKVESTADYLSIKFMSVSPMSAVKSFIADADKILPLSAAISIESARIDDASASDSSPVYRSAIIVRIFFKSPPKTIGKTSDPLPVLTTDHLKTLELINQFERILPSSDDSTPAAAAARLFPE